MIKMSRMARYMIKEGYVRKALLGAGALGAGYLGLKSLDPSFRAGVEKGVRKVTDPYITQPLQRGKKTYKQVFEQPVTQQYTYEDPLQYGYEHLKDPFMKAIKGL